MEGAPTDSAHYCKQEEDGHDSKWTMSCTPVNDPPSHPEAHRLVEDNESYNMSHKQRGIAAIFVHENFTDDDLKPRFSAQEDYNSCEKAFKNLGYEVQKFWDLKKESFLHELKKLANENHSDRDSLVLVVMSHGGVFRGREFIDVYDGRINTCVIWSSFTEDKSPTLAGKPKLIFIQACRGEETDQGFKLHACDKGRSMETKMIPEINEPGYTIPVPRDFLIMWATYPGMYAFKAFRDNIKGSVFIHFLKEVCLEANKGEELYPLLLRVARRVAIEFESSVVGNWSLDKKKQTTYMVSTLRHRVFFS